MNEARPLTRADAVGALRSSLHLLTGTKTQRRAAALIEVLEAEADDGARFPLAAALGVFIHETDPEATFKELKAKKPEAAAWDIDMLMSFFPAAMAEVAGA